MIPYTHKNNILGASVVIITEIIACPFLSFVERGKKGQSLFTRLAVVFHGMDFDF